MSRADEFGQADNACPMSPEAARVIARTPQAPESTKYHAA
ncbi:hypothetical protein BRPE64_ACDS22260 [Caballeronia insecticola]|uniref:Uncharacterized protein n=1 Tax=Caballeronia insecticola TaxID=758793 RepID=R4WSP6_9BURK|nr:hypothetical protein BRPE64_ACDS22260 [Caballeronia insecticola]